MESVRSFLQSSMNEKYKPEVSDILESINTSFKQRFTLSSSDKAFVHIDSSHRLNISSTSSLPTRKTIHVNWDTNHKPLEEGVKIKRDPINFSYINQHQQDYLTYLKERESFRKRAQHNRYMNEAVRKTTETYYKSRSSKLLADERSRKEREDLRLARLPFQLREKQKMYSQLVTDCHKPKIAKRPGETQVPKISRTPDITQKKVPSYKISEIFRSAVTPSPSKKALENKQELASASSAKRMNYLKELSSKKVNIDKLRIPKLEMSAKATYTNEDISAIYKKCQEIEKVATSYERFAGDKFGKDKVRLTEDISNAFLGNIKAKLAIINSLV